MRGPYENDFESARHNGQLQADKAPQILAQKNKKALKTQIDSHTLYFDWTIYRQIRNIPVVKKGRLHRLPVLA